MENSMKYLVRVFGIKLSESSILRALPVLRLRKKHIA